MLNLSRQIRPTSILASLLNINRVYYGTSLITGADRNTFQVLNNSWSKDSTSVYYRTSRIGGMNAATFVAINEEYGHDATQYVRTYNAFGTYSVNALEILGAGYARVGSQIYYERNLISAADASSFQVVSDYPHSIATDSNNLYIGNTIITGTSIDMNSFKYYNSRFFGDNQNIFTPYFKASDTASFKMIGSQYYRDANNVYYYPSTLRTATHLATADPDQFTYMGGSYYKDNNEVFFDGNVLSGLDGSTTVVPLTRFKIAKDADTLYYQSALVNINAASFEVIPYGQLPSSIFLSYHLEALRIGGLTLGQPPFSAVLTCVGDTVLACVGDTQINRAAGTQNLIALPKKRAHKPKSLLENLDR